MVDSPLTGLPLPQGAEIVLDGHIYPDEFATEGPFADHTGYYNAQAEFPVFTVERVSQREDARSIASWLGVETVLENIKDTDPGHRARAATRTETPAPKPKSRSYYYRPTGTTFEFRALGREPREPIQAGSGNTPDWNFPHPNAANRR